jgi:hypothetical protein
VKDRARQAAVLGRVHEHKRGGSRMAKVKGNRWFWITPLVRFKIPQCKVLTMKQHGGEDKGHYCGETKYEDTDENVVYDSHE